ncbi:MAG: nucleotidyltransferase family protein [Patescibacteria group bacterium]
MTKKVSPDVVILCGGLGTRWRAVNAALPKVLAPVHDQPFLNIVIDQFLQQGCKKIILAAGYKADQIETYYQQKPYRPHLAFSKESTPLGTAGAVKLAEPHITSENFFVVNGDSFCTINLQSVVQFHISKPMALATMVMSKNTDRADAGNIVWDKRNGCITNFNEKTDPPSPWINAGIYLFNRKILAMIPAGKNISLEYEIIPTILSQDVYGFPVSSPLIDIGTPERYREALEYFKRDTI